MAGQYRPDPAVLNHLHRGAVPPLPRTLPSLSTPRLLLRAFDAGDSADLFAIYGDSEVMRFVGEPPFPSLATVAQMLASVARLLAA